MYSELCARVRRFESNYVAAGSVRDRQPGQLRQDGGIESAAFEANEPKAG
jgi:hypothetical protein